MLSIERSAARSRASRSASATVTGADCAGLHYLRDKLGDCQGGVTIYWAQTRSPFGDRLAAVPLSGLWSG